MLRLVCGMWKKEKKIRPLQSNIKTLLRIVVAPTVEYCVNGCTPHCSLHVSLCQLVSLVAATDLRFGVVLDTYALCMCLLLNRAVSCCGCSDISTRQPVVTFHDVIDAFEPISGPNNSRGFNIYLRSGQL